MLPEISHQPTFHNPFPQLSRVAVAPFFNHSNEPTLEGDQLAMAYFNELQLVPGFEVVAVSQVQQVMLIYDIELSSPADVRRLAKLLDVDAVVIGAVTDYTPYYPPRLGLQVEWYAANPGFHEIPPGYGLPWGTPEETRIPAPLVFEAEMALAKAQLATQIPTCEEVAAEEGSNTASRSKNVAPGWPDQPGTQSDQPSGVEQASAESGLPEDWPDPRGFIPLPPNPQRPECQPSGQPVIRHTQTYNGHDPEFTEALSSYYHFRDDARYGGWQSYLQRSDDFIRFCCHMHISEMLAARGGAGETRVVWRWPTVR